MIMRFNTVGLFPLEFFWKVKCMRMPHEQFKISNATLKMKLSPLMDNGFLLQKVIENFDVRMQACKKSRGGHMNDIVFHT